MGSEGHCIFDAATRQEELGEARKTLASLEAKVLKQDMDVEAGTIMLGSNKCCI